MLLKYVLIVLGVAFCRACSDTTSTGGCCYGFGSCSSDTDCLQTIGTYIADLNYLSGLQLNAPNDSLVACYQSNCLFLTPSTTCNAIDNAQSSCNDSGYCVNTFSLLSSNSAPTPTTASTPTQTLTSTPTTASTPTQTSTPNPGCIANHQTVTVQGYGTKQINNLTVGDKVYTDKGFKRYIGNIHDSGLQQTLKLYTENNVHIEITHDHLIKTNGKFVQAYTVKVNDVISTTHGDTKINKISHEMSIVSSPLTQSGTIIVNNVLLSCYATDRSHEIVNVIFYPVRVGIIKNVSKYFMLLINIHNAMPKWSKTYISSYSVTL